MITYGDGLSNVNFNELIDFHRLHGKIVTVTGVRPPGRFGEMEIDDSGLITEFNEKDTSPNVGRVSCSLKGLC